MNIIRVQKSLLIFNIYFFITIFIQLLIWIVWILIILITICLLIRISFIIGISSLRFLSLFVSLLKCSYFILVFQVLNLFLALLLSSFGASNLSAAGGGDDDTNKLTEAFSRISRFIRWIKRIIFKAFQYFRDKIVECFRQQLAARRGEKTNI